MNGEPAIFALLYVLSSSAKLENCGKDCGLSLSSDVQPAKAVEIISSTTKMVRLDFIIRLLSSLAIEMFSFRVSQKPKYDRPNQVT